MKRLALVLLIAFFTQAASANIAPPMAQIHEITFDSLNNWTIELGFYYITEDMGWLTISSSSGSSTITNYTLIVGNPYEPGDSIAVITNANLNGPLTIDPANDLITISTHVWGNTYNDYLAIGSHQESIVQCMNPGESIALNRITLNDRNCRSYCIDKSPTIGYNNDTIEAMGSFSGNIIGLDGNPTSGVYIEVPHLVGDPIGYQRIMINSDGGFNERLFARNYDIDTIIIVGVGLSYAYYVIEPISFCLRPMETIDQNVILTEILAVSEPEAKDKKRVVASPNPFNNEVSFYFDFTAQQLQSNTKLTLTIFSLKGELIDAIEVPASQNKIIWHANDKTPSGILFYHFSANNKVIANGKLVKI